MVYPPVSREESTTGIKCDIGGLRFSVPLTPPTANTYTRHTRAGKHYMTSQAHSYRDAVVLYARQAANACTGFQTLRTPVSLRIDCYFPNRHCPDAGNLEKLVCDGLQMAQVITNDNLIDDLRVVRHFGGEPRTEIEISQLS